MLYRFRRWFRRKPAPIIINVVDEKYVAEFCLLWNIRYPIDRWYREKHKLAFNSPEHRSVSLWDMRFEYEEDKLFREKKTERYVPNAGDWMRADGAQGEELSDAEKLAMYKREYEGMNLDIYNTADGRQAD